MPTICPFGFGDAGVEPTAFRRSSGDPDIGSLPGVMVLRWEELPTSCQAVAARGAHHGDVLARRRVVAGPQVERRAEEAHQLVQIGPREPIAEPPAHARDATVADRPDVKLFL